MTSDRTNDKIGRVVIELRSGSPSAVALQEAIHFAQAFDSDLEGLFINDEELEAMAELPVVRSVSLSGRRNAGQASDNIRNELFLAAQSMRRQFDDLARHARLRHQFRTVHDQPIKAMLSACADDQDKSLIVLTETLALRHIAEIDQLMTSSENLFGVLLVGPGASRRSGPVIIVPENLENVETMIRSATMLASGSNPVIIFLANEDEAELQRVSDELHNKLTPVPGLNILSAPIPRDQPAVMTEAVRRLKGGLLITQFGGALVPSKESLASLATALECPLLIMR